MRGRKGHAGGLHSRGAEDAGPIFQAPDRKQDKLARSRSRFKSFSDRIETPGDGLIIFRGLQDYTAESIKSLEGFRIAWVDEAQNVKCAQPFVVASHHTSRYSELWTSWNPRRKSDAVDDFFRRREPAGAVVVKANWRDNPWFPNVLEVERKLDLSLYPERYDHIWEGDYVTAFEGAYFASMLSDARAKGRIGKVTADPLLPLRAFIDIGGSGALADAFTIWIVQWVGQDMRLKQDIDLVGALFDGTPVYGYRYKGAPAYHIGLMAQDVEKTTPNAVIEINGHKAVDYHAATEASRRLGSAA